MSDIEVRTFPANDTEALAMLYVQLQATAAHSPVELLHLYQNAYDAIGEEKDEQYAARFEEI